MSEKPKEPPVEGENSPHKKRAALAAFDGLAQIVDNVTAQLPHPERARADIVAVRRFIAGASPEPRQRRFALSGADGGGRSAVLAWAAVASAVLYAFDPGPVALAVFLGLAALSELASIGRALSRLAGAEPSIEGKPDDSPAAARRRARLEVADRILKAHAVGASHVGRALEYDLRQLFVEEEAAKAAANRKVRYWFRDLDKAAEQSTLNPDELFKPGRVYLRSEVLPPEGEGS